MRSSPIIEARVSLYDSRALQRTQSTAASIPLGRRDFAAERSLIGRRAVPPAAGVRVTAVAEDMA